MQLVIDQQQVDDFSWNGMKLVAYINISRPLNALFVKFLLTNSWKIGYKLLLRKKLRLAHKCDKNKIKCLGIVSNYKGIRHRFHPLSPLLLNLSNISTCLHKYNCWVGI